MRDEQRQLQRLITQASGELFQIGRSLIDDGCIEIFNLIDKINEIRESPLIDDCGTVFGGLCSQSGRLAAVMATMSKIGCAVCEASRREYVPSLQKGPCLTQVASTRRATDHERLLKHQLGSYVKEFNDLGTQLQRLSETDIVFIECDARVLLAHPDLAKAEAIRIRFAAAAGHLETLSESWWGVGENAKAKAAGYEAALAAHLSPHNIN